MSKVIIVTGAAGGIGLSIATLLKEAHYTVIAIDLTLSNELHALEIESHICDLGNSEQVKSVFNTILNNHEDIHGLVNNAGVLSYGSVTSLSEDEWDRVMSVNVKAAFLCAKYTIPQMLTKGVVINVASVQSFLAQPNVAAYATSKAALLGLTRSIAIDYAPKVRCIAVCPGTIDTPMLHNAMKQSPDPEAMMDELNRSHLTDRIGTPNEVASLIKFLLSDECQFITGETIRVDGGLGVNIGGSAY